MSRELAGDVARVIRMSRELAGCRARWQDVGRGGRMSSYHAQTEQFALDVRQVASLDLVEAVLQSRVRVRVAVRELVDVRLAVEAERERQHVVLPVLRTLVVVDELRRQAHPANTAARGR